MKDGRAESEADSRWNGLIRRWDELPSDIAVSVLRQAVDASIREMELRLLEDMQKLTRARLRDALASFERTCTQADSEDEE